MKSLIVTTAALLVGMLVLTAGAHDKGTRSVVKALEAVAAECLAGKVQLDVNHANRIYQENEHLVASIQSARSGYLYLFYAGPNGRVVTVFPNEWQTENHISAGVKITVPGPTAGFQLRVRAPFGVEKLIAIVSPTPLKSLDYRSLTANGAEPVTHLHAQKLQAESKQQRSLKWSSAEVMVRTRSVDVSQYSVPASTPKINRTPSSGPRRFALCVGLNHYYSSSIPSLKACVNDARQMAHVLENHCGFEKVIVLLDEKATLGNIRLAFRQLNAWSRNGDLIVHYHSGHGARCADVSGDETDGLDEYLVTYNGERRSITAIRNTMLLDDEYDRMVGLFTGRRFVSILDTCYSSGAAKGLNDRADVNRFNTRKLQPIVRSNDFGYDFVPQRRAGLWARFRKAADEPQLTLLSSSTATQISFEREDGQHSVMTGFLLDLLTTRRVVTLKQAYESVRYDVGSYVRAHFPGAVQTPQLSGTDGSQIFLKGKSRN